MADKGDVNKRIAEIRADYARDSLDEGDLSDDPIEQLRLWMDEAVKADVWEPNAMTLATVGEDKAFKGKGAGLLHQLRKSKGKGDRQEPAR